MGGLGTSPTSPIPPPSGFPVANGGGVFSAPGIAMPHYTPMVLMDNGHAHSHSPPPTALLQPPAPPGYPASSPSPTPSQNLHFAPANVSPQSPPGYAPVAPVALNASTSGSGYVGGGRAVPTTSTITIISSPARVRPFTEEERIDFEAMKSRRDHQARLKQQHEAIRQARDLEFTRTKKELEEIRMQSELEISQYEREVQQKMEAIERLQRRNLRATQYIDRLSMERAQERNAETEACREIERNIAELEENVETARQSELENIRNKLRRHTELQTHLAQERAIAEVERKEQLLFMRDVEHQLKRKVEELLDKEGGLERELIGIEERRKALEVMNMNSMPVSRARMNQGRTEGSPRAAPMGYSPLGRRTPPANSVQHEPLGGSGRGWEEEMGAGERVPLRPRNRTA